MAASLILPFGALFNVVPYAILCIYPLRHRLGISPCVLTILLFFLFSTEFLLYLTVQNMPYFVVQVIYFIYIAVYLTAFLCFVRMNIYMLIYFFFAIADYAAIIIGISNYLDIQLFARCRHVGGYSVQLILIHLLLFFLSLPVITYVITKKIIPLFNIENVRLWKKLWVVSPAFLITVVIFSGSDSDKLISSWQYIAISILLAISGYVALCIITEVLFRTDESTALQEKTRMMEMLLDFQKRDYEKMSRQIAETRAARHDLRHHLSLVSTYLQEEKYDELRAYLNEYKSLLPQAGGPPVSENYAVNAILQYYAELAKTENVQIRMQAAIPQRSDFADSDLCIVFGNCLENAIEACRRMKSGSRYIRVNAKTHGGVLGIAVDNSFDGTVKLQDGRILSKKRVNEEGIGLSSIRAIAEKYNGKAIFNYSACEFQVSVVLHRKEKNETSKRAIVSAKG